MSIHSFLIRNIKVPNWMHHADETRKISQSLSLFLLRHAHSMFNLMKGKIDMLKVPYVFSIVISGCCSLFCANQEIFCNKTWNWIHFEFQSACDTIRNTQLDVFNLCAFFIFSKEGWLSVSFVLHSIHSSLDSFHSHTHYTFFPHHLFV